MTFVAGHSSAIHVQAVVRAGLVLRDCSPGRHVDCQGVQPQGVQWRHRTERVHWCFLPQDSQQHWMIFSYRTCLWLCAMPVIPGCNVLVHVSVTYCVCGVLLDPKASVSASKFVASTLIPLGQYGICTLTQVLHQVCL